MISIYEPEVQDWAEKMNQRESTSSVAYGDVAGGEVRERKGPSTSVAHGGVGAGGRPQANKVDVMEIYSPPRITVEAKKHGLKPGEALYLITGYDFNREEDR